MLKHNDSATELLTILQEECAEVIQEASKVKRFGQNAENLDRLAKEIGDLVCMIQLVQDWQLVAPSDIETNSAAKKEKLKVWSNLFEDTHD